MFTETSKIFIIKRFDLLDFLIIRQTGDAQAKRVHHTAGIIIRPFLHHPPGQSLGRLNEHQIV